jgi:hypothetical protein
MVVGAASSFTEDLSQLLDNDPERIMDNEPNKVLPMNSVLWHQYDLVPDIDPSDIINSMYKSASDATDNCNYGSIDGVSTLLPDGFPSDQYPLNAISSFTEVGYILLDSSSTLFPHFHGFVTLAVTAHVNSYMPSQPLLSYNFCKWKSCNFIGSEGLDKVSAELNLVEVSCGPYLKFLEHIPMINLLFHYDAISTGAYAISLHVSLNTFNTFYNKCTVMWIMM